MLRLFFWLLVSAIVSTLSAQSPTEVYLFDLVPVGGGYLLQNPQNISVNPGYDNQPSFLLDGKSLLWASEIEGQTEVMRYYLANGQKEQLTQTEGSEYSPTPIPEEEAFSAILLEKDETQLLWRYSLDGSESEVLVPNLKIGYHCWYDANILFSFVLGEPATLQRTNLETQTHTVLAENIGRSLHRIPGEAAISFVHKVTEEEWWISRCDVATGNIGRIAPTPQGSEDMCWLPDGRILIGDDSRILLYKSGDDSGWQVFADLAEYGLEGITRLAVSPDSKHLAVVVKE